MNTEREVPAGASADHVLPGGCFLCDGDLSIRVTPVGVVGYCASCHRISRAHVVRDEAGVRVVHTAVAVA
jgi:hypothetical protein